MCQLHLDASDRDKKVGVVHFRDRKIGVVHLLSLLSPILPMPAKGRNVSPSTSLEFAFTPNSGRQITRCLRSKHSLKLDPHGAVTRPPAITAHLGSTFSSVKCQAKHWTHCTFKTSLGIQASALTPPWYFIACLVTLLSCHSTEVVPHILSPLPPPREPTPSRCGSRLHPRGPTMCSILPSGGCVGGAAAAFILISFLLAASPHQEPARRAMTTCTYSSPNRQKHNKCVKNCKFWIFATCL